MAPALLLALALFAADPDAAVATAADAAPVGDTPGLSDTASDYETVAWCYGALGAHMGLYDVAMPEVERIERQWSSSPEAAEQNIAGYQAQREAGKKELALYRGAMTAAEKASIQPIQAEGVAAIHKGEAIWTGARLADPKRLAREWMSWGLPERCTETAEKLEANAAVLGQALSYNVGEESAPVEEDAAAAEAAPDEAAPAEEPAEAEAPASIDEIIEDDAPGE